MDISNIEENKIRGDEKRGWLVANYELIPFSHIKLLKDQQRRCICGNMITSSYHIFHAKDKHSKKKTNFHAGPHCAKDLIERSGSEAIPIINILQDTNFLNTNNSEGGERNLSSRIKFSKFNFELCKVIALYCANKDEYPDSIATITEFTVKVPLKDNHRGAEWFNERLIKDDTKISTILNKLAIENNIKNFSFPLLNDFLNNKEVDCRIDV